MRLDWTIDVGNILAVLVPVLGALWGSVRGLYRSVEKLGQIVAQLQADANELRTLVVDAGKQQDELRERLTRIETLLEVILPLGLADADLRRLLRARLRGPGRETE